MTFDSNDLPENFRVLYDEIMLNPEALSERAWVAAAFSALRIMHDEGLEKEPILSTASINILIARAPASVQALGDRYDAGLPL